MKPRKIVASLLLLGITIATAKASGHGPVFGLATPTNAQGGWALDLGVMGRAGTKDISSMFRGMLSYGITEDLQVSFTVPAVFKSAPLAPGRLTGLMPANTDFEAIMAWRFHRQGADVGLRFESTAFGGIVVPGPQEMAGIMGQLAKAPGFWTAAATGFASRSHYLWFGAGYNRFAERKGDRRPDLFFYSLVWGYRPPPWRKDYPHWDWRLFAELTGELSGRLLHRGAPMPESTSHQVLIGPTTLGIYKNIAISGGIQFPIFRDAGALYQKEKFRFAANFAYFF